MAALREPPRLGVWGPAPEERGVRMARKPLVKQLAVCWLGVAARMNSAARDELKRSPVTLRGAGPNWRPKEPRAPRWVHSSVLVQAKQLARVRQAPTGPELTRPARMTLPVRYHRLVACEALGWSTRRLMTGVGPTFGLVTAAMMQ